MPDAMADIASEPAVTPPPNLGVMNDSSFDTIVTSNDKGTNEGDTCRICRSEGTVEEPLFYPCKCSGSIKFVHQDCLMEWLSHSNKKHCELCKTPFRFTKLYHSHMPDTLPWLVFMQRAVVHSMQYALLWLRAAVVSTVWLLLLPWCIRWAWRGLFFVMDAGWAREPWIAKIEADALKEVSGALDLGLFVRQSSGPNRTNTSSTGHEHNSVSEPLFFLLAKHLWNGIVSPLQHQRELAAPQAAHTGRLSRVAAQSSLLSEVKSVNSFTSSPWINRVILDVLEGQIITLVVVVAFILVFLIREWVVQQQPILNAAAHIREAELNMNRIPQRRLAAGEEDRLLAAFAELPEEEDDLETLGENFEDARPSQPIGNAPRDRTTADEFIGWDALEARIRDASQDADTQSGDPRDIRTERINIVADEILVQIERSIRAGTSVREAVRRFGGIVEGLPMDIRSAWFSRLIEINKTQALAEQAGLPDQASQARVATDANSTGDEEAASSEEADPDAFQRPGMPPRESSIQANGILRAMEEEAASQMGAAETSGPGSTGSTESSNDWEDVQVALAADSSNSRSASRNAPTESNGSQPDSSFDQRTPGDASGGSQVDMQNGAHNDSIERQEAQGVGPNQVPALQQMLDWFWADIVPDAPGADPLPDLGFEAFLEDDLDDAPFADFADAEEGLAAMADDELPQDPEVMDAAAQAGLDAEAVDEAEDFEGILELIGMHGPLLALLQTAFFCGGLVSFTLWGAVGAPYLFGKLALLFIGDPVLFSFVLPSQFISGFADFVLDATTCVFGTLFYWCAKLLIQWSVGMPAALGMDRILSPLDSLASSFGSACAAAAERLVGMFVAESTGEVTDSGYLCVSIQAHASLKTLIREIALIVTGLARHATSALTSLPDITACEISAAIGASLSEIYTQARWYTGSAWQAVSSMARSGDWTMTVRRTTPITVDPSLAYWSATDRALAVLAGYAFLAMIGSAYLLREEPILTSPSLRKIEKSFADVLKQAGGVLKVILIISIEMLAFPLYCGLLLDCALLPLFEGASITSRLAFADRAPYMFTFVHWFIGTCYMFHFALFVSMCRRMMRAGVLYFIRDPDDPTFHPVRDVLERNVTTQLRKIGFSALVYGALVILCLGGIVWGIAHAFDGIFPIRWAAPESILEFPVDFILYNFLTPVGLRLLKPSNGLERIYEWWLRRAARKLRLSHFLLGEREHDEEGRHVHSSWTSFLMQKTAVPDLASPREDRRLLEGTSAGSNDVAFIRDGKYVRAPATDQVRIPKGQRVFVEVTEDDDRTDGEPDRYGGTHGRKDKNFEKVYIPPWFRLRIGLFLASLWLFSAIMALSMTVAPLLVGRKIFSLSLPTHVHVNDIYALAAGLYILGSTLYTVLHGRAGLHYMKRTVRSASLEPVIRMGKTYGLQSAKCLYVYGFAVIVVPSLFALILQFYLIVPLHTYLPQVNDLVSTVEAGGKDLFRSSGTSPAMIAQPFQHQQLLASPKIHVLQDWTLGFLYSRIAIRLVTLSRNSRPAAAIRMIARDGYLDPNARLATRAFILPTILLFALLLLGPLFTAAVANNFILGFVLPAGSFSHVIRTKVYRYSYPVVASQVLVAWGMWETIKATKRWRSAIRDEVYLIGEKLHNWGEVRPPAGSKSVVRKIR